jgi:hypothetical protein
MENLSVNQLIQYFEARLRQKDRRGAETAGSEPQFPQVIFYLGDRAAALHGTLSRELFRLWPQYREELCFLGVHAPEEDGLFEMGEDGTAEELDAEQLQRRISGLFGLETHFRDRSKLLVYYILDTTDLVSGEEFDQWLACADRMGELMVVDRMSMLVVLLNEDLGNGEAAGKIRGRLSGLCAGGAGRDVFLLSNRRSDHVILESWELECQILADLIALSNNRDTRVTLTLFSGGVKTVSYAREEKPSADIGQVIVRGLIDRLNESREGPGNHESQGRELPERLGVTRAGTVELLDRYVEETLLAKLPSAQQLAAFPREDDADHGALAEMSAAEFNRFTMGSWNCYLRRIGDEAAQAVLKDQTLRETWRQAYRELLLSRFTADELAALGGRLREVGSLYGETRAPSEEARVLSAAASALKHRLSSDPEITQMLVQTVGEESQSAAEFTRIWTELLQSCAALFRVRDRNLETFYARKARDYFDRRGAEQMTAFRELHSPGELRDFLTRMMDELIDGEPVLTAPFESELERRLEGEAMPIDAKTYIRQKLTGEGISTYLRVNFALSNPIFSAMLVKRGTPLYANLAANLDETTYYYDTGCGERAESLAVYQLEAGNLLNE